MLFRCHFSIHISLQTSFLFKLCANNLFIFSIAVQTIFLPVQTLFFSNIHANNFSCKTSVRTIFFPLCEHSFHFQISVQTKVSFLQISEQTNFYSFHKQTQIPIQTLSQICFNFLSFFRHCQFLLEPFLKSFPQLCSIFAHCQQILFNSFNFRTL